MVLLLAESRAAMDERGAAEDWLRQATELAEGTVSVESGPFAVLRQIEPVPGAVARGPSFCAISSTQARLGFTEAARRARLSGPRPPLRASDPACGRIPR
jgi:hypothetical protein